MTDQKLVPETLREAEGPEAGSSLDAWRERSLNILLVVASGLALPALAIFVSQTIGHPDQWVTMTGFIILYLVLLGLTVLRRIDARVRAGVLLVSVYAASLLALARGGLAGDGRLYLFSVPVLALILINTRAGLVAAGITLITFGAFAVMNALGWADAWLSIRENPTSLGDWLDRGIAMTMMMIPIVVLLRQFTRFQIETMQKEHEAAEKLARTSESLRNRAQQTEKTNRILREQASSLAAAAEVAQKTISLANAEELMAEFVSLTTQHFSLYHTGLFLIDPNRHVAILRAASSVRGQQMIDQGYEVDVGAQDLVGQVAYAGEVRVHRVEPGSMPEFPQSKWRVTLPLHTADAVIGVLDFHLYPEEEPSPSVVQALGTLANQLAVGLEGTRHREQLESSLEELSRLNRLMTGETWQRYVQELPEGSLRHVSGEEIPQKPWSEALVAARERGQAILTTQATEDSEDRQVLVVPVRLRGASIGMIGFQRSDEEDEWRPQDIELAERMVDRFAQTLENIRLLEETRRRAARERVVSDISSRLRASLDPDVILRTTVQELGRILNAELTTVEITGPDGGNGDPPDRPPHPREEG